MKNFGKYVSTKFHQLRQNFGEEEGHALEFLLLFKDLKEGLFKLYLLSPKHPD